MSMSETKNICERKNIFWYIKMDQNDKNIEPNFQCNVFLWHISYEIFWFSA